MNILRRYSIAAYIFGMPFLFLIGAVIFESSGYREFLYGLAMIAMLVVSVLWFDEAVAIVIKNKTDGPSLVNLAIFLTAFLLLENRSYALLNYKLGNPGWLYESYFPAFIVFQVAAIGLLNIVALVRYRRDTIQDRDEHAFDRRLSLAIKSAILITAIYLFLIIS